MISINVTDSFSVMVSDQMALDLSRDGDIGGLSAFMYFLTVFLCMLSSRAIPRMDSPLHFAFCTALHLAVCNGVGFLHVGVAALRTRLVPLRPEASTGCSASWLVSGVASLAIHLIPRPLVG